VIGPDSLIEYYKSSTGQYIYVFEEHFEFLPKPCGPRQHVEYIYDFIKQALDRHKDLIVILGFSGIHPIMNMFQSLSKNIKIYTDNYLDSTIDKLKNNERVYHTDLRATCSKRYPVCLMLDFSESVLNMLNTKTDTQIVFLFYKIKDQAVFKKVYEKTFNKLTEQDITSYFTRLFQQFDIDIEFRNNIDMIHNIVNQFKQFWESFRKEAIHIKELKEYTKEVVTQLTYIFEYVKSKLIEKIVMDTKNKKIIVYDRERFVSFGEIQSIGFRPTTNQVKSRDSCLDISKINFFESGL